MEKLGELLATKGFFPKMKGGLYGLCIQTAILPGSEMWTLSARRYVKAREK